MNDNLTREVAKAISSAINGKTDDINSIFSAAINGCATFMITLLTSMDEEEPEIEAADMFRQAADQLEMIGGEE